MSSSIINWIWVPSVLQIARLENNSTSNIYIDQARHSSCYVCYGALALIECVSPDEGRDDNYATRARCIERLYNHRLSTNSLFGLYAARRFQLLDRRTFMLAHICVKHTSNTHRLDNAPAIHRLYNYVHVRSDLSCALRYRLAAAYMRCTTRDM